ncbi:MAG: TlpA disulfide reductase family protein, partial [Pseudomonadota bacterium]
MNNSKILLLICGVAIVAGAAGYVTRQSLQPTPTVVETADVVNEDKSLEQKAKPLWFWAFDDLSGNKRLLSEWKGPYLVINFWATWCPPCLKEIPSFNRLQQAFGEERIQFIGIAYDHLDSVEKFVADTKVEYPVLIGGDDAAIFMRELGNKIGGLPFTA